MPLPLNCDANKYLAGVAHYRELNGDKECVENESAACNKLPENKVEPGQGRSICRNIYRKIVNTLNEYEASLSHRCHTSNAALDICKSKPPWDASQIECLSSFGANAEFNQEALGRLMQKAQDRLADLAEEATKARDRYREQRKKSKFQGPMLSGNLTLGAASIDIKCLVGSNSKRDPLDLLKPVPGKPDSEGRIIDEQTEAIRLALSFRAEAEKAIEAHQKLAREFRAQAESMADLAKRVQSADPAAPIQAANEKNNSDITGTAPKQASAPQPANGKAEEASGGGREGNQGGSGATSGTPGSTNDFVSSKSKYSNAPGDKLDPILSSGSGSTEKGVVSTPLSKVSSVSNQFGNASNLAKSRSPSSLRNSGSGKMNAASRMAVGGVGIGGLGKGGVCMGADCKQALGNLKTSQFAPVGSLGAGGGFGIDGSAGSLDGLFNTENADQSAMLSPDALDGLDSSVDLGAGEAERGEPGLGVSNGRNLFSRVHDYHTRALKQGRLVGVPKKL